MESPVTPAVRPKLTDVNSLNQTIKYAVCLRGLSRRNDITGPSSRGVESVRCVNDTGLQRRLTENYGRYDNGEAQGAIKRLF